MVAFELWCYRRMVKTPWTARSTSEEILNRIVRERECLHEMKVRKTSYLGHIFRHQKNELLQLIMKGKMEGKKRGEEKNGFRCET